MGWGVWDFLYLVGWLAWHSVLDVGGLNLKYR